MPPSNRKISWPVLAAAVTFAAGIWAAYAFKNGAFNRPAQVTVGSASPEEAKLTFAPLRATAARPTASPTERSADHQEASLEPSSMQPALSSSVRANASPQSGSAIEMTLSNISQAHAPAAVTPPPAPIPESQSQIQAAREALTHGDYVSARTALATALNKGLPTEDQAFARQELLRLANSLIFSRTVTTADPLVAMHIVEAGDTVNALAHRYHLTEEMIASINKMPNAHALNIGARLKMLRGPFHAVISKSHHQMDVYLGQILVRSFTVGLGTNGKTPTGKWVVKDKLNNPDWTDPVSGRHYFADDPDNPIGEYWIALTGVSGDAVGKTGFGIHGTIDPASIGQNQSMGCVRMLPDDIAAVFNMLVLHDSQVIIRP